MSSYQDGYDKGYEDAINGERNICEGGGPIYDIISLISDDDKQEDWEDGYRAGYEAGEDELS